MVRLAAVVATAALSALLAAPVMANQPPEVTDATVTPPSLPYVGGTVTVSAIVRDLEGAAVESAFIRFTTGGSGSGFSEAFMTQGNGEDWTGLVEIPPNFDSNPVTWRFTVVGRDLDLAETPAFAGTVEVAGWPGFDDPPTAFDPSVSPRSLPSTGGPVTLEVSATDAIGVKETFAVINGGTNVPLAPIGNDRFRGVFNAPANLGTSPVPYSVGLVAVDALGQQAVVDGGLITVSDKPSGRLEVKPGALGFGAAKVGKHKHRTLVLRNRGGKSSLPVEGVITTSGAPFSILGAPTTGLPFCLRAGKSLHVELEFRPTAAGDQSGTLTVTRADTVQPPLTVALTGTGLAGKKPPAAHKSPPARRTCR